MTPAAPVGDDAPPPSAEPGKWAKWRADLTALGGFDNELVAVPAGPVSEMIACGEALARDNSELLRETTVTAYRKLEVTHAEALRKLAAAERCIRAADVMVDSVFCLDREAYDKARLCFAGDDALAKPDAEGETK